MKRLPNPNYVNAPYELSFRWHGPPPKCITELPPLRFTKPPPASVWKDRKKWDRWRKKNALNPYLP